jgi:hypothetical protein
MPPSRNSQSFDDLDNNSCENNNQRNERRRINKFENSQYYLSPPSPVDKSSAISSELDRNKDNNNSTNNSPSEEITNKCLKQEHSENESSPNRVTKSNNNRSTTIELTGVTSNKQEKIHENNKILNESNDDSLNKNDDEDSLSHCMDYSNYTFVEKFVSIERPFDYSSRGFGFLLNSGVASKVSSGNAKGNLFLNATSLVQNVINQNFAQIVVVEHGKLYLFASKLYICFFLVFIYLFIFCI